MLQHSSLEHRVYVMSARAHIPQQQVDEDGDGEEGASDAGVTTQEEDEVAEETEEDHPYHVQLKEQVEGVEAPCHSDHVFHKRGET